MQVFKWASAALAVLSLWSSRSAAVVFTPGEHGVNDHGASTYAIPLALPPAAAGLGPKMSLQYNSQGGDGVFGVGWGLSGMSVIARCARTMAQDGVRGSVNFDANDRLCLENQRLIAISGAYGADGTHYRFERDEFTRVVGKGQMGSGSAWFEVTRRDGTVLQYGASNDSRIEAQGKTVAAVWALYRVIDTSNNYLEWRYAENNANGEWYPDRVLYTGNLGSNPLPTFAEVRFLTYGAGDPNEARPDQVPLYRAGSKVLLTKRIRKIQTYVQGALVRDYRLDYDTSANSGRSRIVKVTECDAAGSCLLPTTVSWGDGTAGAFSGQWQELQRMPSIGHDHDNSTVMELNGDGKSDILIIDERFGAAVAFMSQPAGAHQLQYYAEIGGRAHFNHGNYFFRTDVNGDGIQEVTERRDWMLLTPAGSDRATWSGQFSDTVNYDEWSGYSNLTKNRFFPMDVDADGRTDMVHRDASGILSIWISNGVVFQNAGSHDTGVPDAEGQLFAVGDVNGDGFPDLICAAGSGIVYWLGTGSGFTTAIAVDVSVSAMRLSVVDINGDGLDDLAVCSGHDGLTTLVSTGANFYHSGGGHYGYCASESNKASAEFADVNGDGRGDMVITNLGIHAYLSNGVTFATRTSSLPIDTDWAGDFTLLDINGDGRTDVMSAAPSYPRENLAVWSLKDTSPDVVRNLENGIGERISFEYDYLSSGSGTYSKEASSGYPVIGIQPPLLVTKSVTKANLPPATCGTFGTRAACASSPGSDPNPTMITVGYRYGGLMMELGTGRGSQGFRWVEATEQQTGVATKSEFEQRFPLTGMLKSQVTRVPSGGEAGVIKRSTFANQFVELPGRRYFKFVAQSSESTWDLNGSARPSVTVSNTYDCQTSPSVCYGNLKRTSAAAADGHLKITEVQHLNDAAKWLLGLPTRVAVTSTVPFGSGLPLAPPLGDAPQVTKTRTSGFDYDSRGRLAKEITEPGGRASDCLVNAHTYDTRGNRNSTTIRSCVGSEGNGALPGSPGYFAPRTTTTTYGDSNGRFPTHTQNPAGHVQTQVMDARFGLSTFTSAGLLAGNPDQPGLVSTTTYDGFGRATLNVNVDNTESETNYLVCGDGGCSPTAVAAGARYGVRTTLRDLSGAAIGPEQTVYFDRLARQVARQTQGFAKVGAPPSIYETKRYDGLGRVTSQSRAFYEGQASVHFGPQFYDILGRVQVERTEDGRWLEYVYDGTRVTVRNQLGQATTKETNSQSQVVRITDALGSALVHRFDPFGNLVQTLDVAGNRIDLQYDLRGRKVQMSDPDLGSYRYEYNAVGEQLSYVDPNEQMTRMEYDSLGRMLRRMAPDLIGEWSYDQNFDGSTCLYGVGQMCELRSDDGYVSSKTFDSAGRPVTAWTQIDGASFSVRSEYDEDTGRLSKQVYPTGLEVVYDYTPQGYLSKVQNAERTEWFWEADAEDAEGHTTQFRFGNGVLTEMTYESFSGRTTAVLAGAGTVQNLLFQWDARTGNLSAREDQNQGLIESFGYDALNRLTTSSVNASAVGPGVTTHFGYDLIGNVVCKSDLGACNDGANYRMGAQVGEGGQRRTMPHAVASITGSVHGSINPSYVYDIKGNMLDGAGRSMTYTSFNMPLTMSKAGFVTEFSYGPEHQRVKQESAGNGTIRTLLYLHPDQANGLLYERETFGSTTTHNHYITARGQVVALVTLENGAWDTKYFHRDNLGSVTSITDRRGVVIERMAYDSWGKRRFPDGRADPSDGLHADPTVRYNTDRGYTNQEMLDELGLIHMNGRVFDPSIARFLTPDPTVPSPEWLQDYNRFSYVLNNPFTATDPTGFSDEGPENDGEIGDPNESTMADVLFVQTEDGYLQCDCAAGGVFTTLGGDAHQAGLDVSYLAAFGSGLYGDLADFLDGRGASLTIISALGRGIAAARGRGVQERELQELEARLAKALSELQKYEELRVVQQQKEQPVVVAAKGLLNFFSRAAKAGAKPLSPNQMNKAIQTGKAPKGLERVDTGKVPGEQTHVHLNGGAALNKDGTWKHGEATLTAEQATWLQQQGWSLP